LGADPGAIGMEAGKLILEQYLAVVQQASGQRRFSVIDAAARHETKEPLGMLHSGLPIRTQCGMAH